MRKANNQAGFVVLARTWVERFFAWINRNRRLAKTWNRQSHPQRPSSTPPALSSCYDDWNVNEPTRARLKPSQIGRSVISRNSGKDSTC